MSAHIHCFTQISIWTWTFHYTNTLHGTQNHFAGKRISEFSYNTLQFLIQTKLTLLLCWGKNGFKCLVLGPEAECNNYTC